MWLSKSEFIKQYSEMVIRELEKRLEEGGGFFSEYMDKADEIILDRRRPAC